jgi:hypothetical protein
MVMDGGDGDGDGDASCDTAGRRQMALYYQAFRHVGVGNHREDTTTRTRQQGTQVQCAAPMADQQQCAYGVPIADQWLAVCLWRACGTPAARPLLS